MFARLFPKSTYVLVCFLVISTMGLVVTRGYAQVVGATLSGTITDPSGAVVPNAQVSVRNTSTGVTRAVTADTAGLYVAPNLLPGTYEVTVMSLGFNTSRESNVVLGVGAEQQLNFSLKVGETTQTVQVTEAAPMVQVTSSTLSSEVESTTVRELPLNGRDWASLATLSSGVNAIETQMPYDAGARRGNRGFGFQLTISGGRPTQNNYRLDGLSIDDHFNGTGSTVGVSLGVDAIQEFSVVTGNYSAEYGRTSGGIVNAVSKSGTNAFHGDAYEFLRNDKLDANDFFSNAAGKAKPPYKRNQFGAAAGGPIIKDRTFIFGDYEGIRQVEGVPSSGSHVLSDNARLGILSKQMPLAPGTPCPAGALNLAPGRATICVDENIAANSDLPAGFTRPNGQKYGYLDLYPHANGTQTGNVGNFVFAPIQRVHENFVTTRLDHKFTDNDSIFATYMRDDSPFTTQDGFDLTRVQNQVTRDVAALEWSHTFTPTLLNNARLGYNRSAVINYQTVGAINPAAADSSLSIMPGYGSPQIFIGGVGQLSAPGFPGGFTHFNWNSIQFYDDAFLTRGTHSLKFGFATENMRFNPFNLYLPTSLVRFTGGATGNAVADFLTNQPHSFEGGLPNKVSPREYRQTLFGGYIQDDWHWRHNLTLNLGLRYEMTTVLKDVQGKLSSLRNLSDPLPYCGTTDINLTSVFGAQGCAGVAPYFSNPTTHNFEPRLGFAWDPRGDGKMAVRGGFAIFDILPLPGYFFTQAWAPFFLTGTVVNSAATPLAGTMGVPPASAGSAFSFFGPAASKGCTSPLGTCKLTAPFVEPNPKRNYVQQWNINFQRQITPSLTATVGYVGSHGVHMLIRGDDFDYVIPCPPSCGPGSVQIPGKTAWPFNPTGADLRINRDFGLIRGIMWNTDALYEGATVNVQKRLSHGFQFGGSYTYSHGLDDNSSTQTGDALSNSITTWFWFNPKLSRALSDFNITHSVAINGIWDVPGPKSLHGFAGTLSNGWELGSIFKVNSGVPTTPLIAGDPMNAENNGSDTFGIPDIIPGCDPVNHNYKSNPNGVFLGYINTSCYTMPTAPASFASQCMGFPGATTPAPAGQVYCANVLGNAGRNSIIGPGLVNLDFSVYKNFPVRKMSESSSVQFRAEFFNILNRANFAPPLPFFGAGSSQIFNQDGSLSGGGGLQQPLVTKPRDIQFALKFIW